MSAHIDIPLHSNSGSLDKHTNWWGAFVVGLAGTILVTGIAPFAVVGMGGSGNESAEKSLPWVSTQRSVHSTSPLELVWSTSRRTSSSRSPTSRR